MTGAPGLFGRYVTSVQRERNPETNT